MYLISEIKEIACYLLYSLPIETPDPIRDVPSIVYVVGLNVVRFIQYAMIHHLLYYHSEYLLNIPYKYIPTVLFLMPILAVH